MTRSRDRDGERHGVQHGVGTHFCLALTSVWHSLLSVVLAYTSLITVLRERLAEIFTLNSVVTSIYNDGASLCVYGILIYVDARRDVHMPCVIRISHESHDAWSLDGRRVFLRSGDGDRFTSSL